MNRESSAPAEDHGGPLQGRARLRAYGLWQMRDYLMDRGAPTGIVVTLFAYIVVGPMHAMAAHSIDVMSPRAIAARGGPEVARQAMLHEVTSSFLGVFLGNLVFLGALFAMNGLVATDRKQGFYRFLFSKPLSPVAYYGQAFVLHWAGFLAVTSLLGVLYGALVAPVLSVPLVIVLALMYLCYAGIAFALTAVARWDWLSLVAVTVAATYFWGRYEQSTSPLARLLYLLPPVHRTSEVYSAVARGMELPWLTMLWLAGYGAICVLVGLVVLRYRRLAII